MENSFWLDDQAIPFQQGDSVLDAAMAAGIYIPHLCYLPGLPPHSSCRLCAVAAGGRFQAACTLPAESGLRIGNRTPELEAMRRTLLQMLFIEGQHICPACERSGDCKLQATAYELGMQDNHFPQRHPSRPRDASHPDVLLDRDRCILCELCVRASRDLDHKGVFGITGRGIHTRLVVNSPSGLLVDSRIDRGDTAIQVCPVGALMVKRQGFETPIGDRSYDREPIRVAALREYRSWKETGRGR
jgi:[NiFe] hydrogenase diaphorase moiety small subunit